jgi:AsmA protein
MRVTGFNMLESLSSPVVAVPARRCLFKKAAWISGATICFLLLVVLIAPKFVDLGLFKRTYLPLIEDALNRRVDVSEVRLSLLPTPSIRLSSLRISDNARFAGNTFFSAEQVRLRLKLLPLLRGRFDVTELVLDRPVLNLLKEPDGTFNYSDIVTSKNPVPNRRETAKKPQAMKPVEAPVVTALVPKNLSVKAGQVNLISKAQPPINISGVDLSLRQFSSNEPFPFRGSFSYPGLKTISLEGQLSYREDKSILELKNNRLKIHELSFPLEGSVANPFTSPRLDLSIRSDNVEARTVFQILSVFGLLTQARGLFKNVQVNGKRALKGSLSGQVAIRLPLGAGSVSRRLKGEGNVSVRDGELTHVDLIKKIERVTGMIGLSKNQQRQATTFKTMEADFILGNGHAEFTRLYLVNPQLEVRGAGTMTLDQPTLDLAISTALSAEASTRAGHGKVSTFFKDKQGRIVVPLRINGPVENPSVNFNSEKLLEAGLPQNAEKGFSSFFKRLFGR